MFRPLKEMLIPLTTVLAHIDERQKEFSRFGFETEKMREVAENLSQNGSIPGNSLQRIFGVLTSEFLVTL